MRGNSDKHLRTIKLGMHMAINNQYKRLCLIGKWNVESKGAYFSSKKLNFNIAFRKSAKATEGKQ